MGWFCRGKTNTIDFVTFASTGSATDFGDLLEESNNGGSVSDSTREQLLPREEFHLLLDAEII